jgi:2-methylisocitrate lyase-like PEP mutase family enzyme
VSFHQDSDGEKLQEQAELLARLHRGRLLVLPNAWDAVSARMVEGSGFPVVATSSGAIAASLGFEDNDSMPVEEAFGAIARIARSVGAPVTADIEAGYRLPAGELVERLLGAGAAGCNLEDTDHRGGGLVSAETQATRLADIKTNARRLGVDIVVNARVDLFIQRRAERPADLLPEAIERAQRYVDAGADCVYPIALNDEALIGAFVDAVQAPVNILARKAPPLNQLATLGVARVSLAGDLFRVGLAAVQQRLAAVAAEIT